MSEVYLVRHGSTNLNSAIGEKLRGWKDVTLNPEGRRQAQAVAKQLGGLKGRARMVVSSDLSRATETARIIAHHIGAEHVPTAGARTWNIGDFAGKSAAASTGKLNDLVKNPTKAVPGGEPYQNFYDRWKETLGEAQKHAGETGEPVVLVTHHSNLLAVPSILRGDGKAESAHRGKPEPGGVMKLSQDGKGGWTAEHMPHPGRAAGKGKSTPAT